MLKHHVPKSSELFRISSKGYYYKISLLVSLVTIFIITDILLSNISPASIPVDNFIHSNAGIILFILFSLASAVAQIAATKLYKKERGKTMVKQAAFEANSYGCYDRPICFNITHFYNNRSNCLRGPL